MHELAEPYPMAAMSHGQMLDRLYDTLDDDDPRSDRIEWAVLAGGEVR